MIPKDRESPIAVNDNKVCTVEGGILRIRSFSHDLLANVTISQAFSSPYRVLALRWNETEKLGVLVNSAGSNSVLVIHPANYTIFLITQPRLQMIADFHWFGESVAVESENKLNLNFYICDSSAQQYRIYNQLIYPKMTASRPKSCIESYLIRKSNKDILLNLVKTGREAILMNQLTLNTLDCQQLEWSPCGTHFFVIDSSVKGTIRVGNLFVAELFAATPTSSATVISWGIKDKLHIAVGDIRGDVIVYSVLRNLEVEFSLRSIDTLKPGLIFQQDASPYDEHTLFRRSDSLPGAFGKSRSVTCIAFTSRFMVTILECRPSVLFIWESEKPILAIVSSLPILGHEIKPERDFILFDNGLQILFWVSGELPKVVYYSKEGIKRFRIVDEDSENVRVLIESSTCYCVVNIPLIHREMDTTAISHVRRGSSPMYENESASVRRIIDEVQQKEWGDPKLNNVSLTRVINDGDTFKHKKMCR